MPLKKHVHFADQRGYPLCVVHMFDSDLVAQDSKITVGEKVEQDQQPGKEVELANQDKFVVSRFLKRFAPQWSVQQCAQVASEALRSKVPLHGVKYTSCTAH